MPTLPSPSHWSQWGALVLRLARERAGLTREQFAAQTGLATATIRNVECGHIQTPDPRTLRLLCAALSLPVPGEEGLYLSLDEVPADRIRHLTGDALREYALRRQDPRRFVSRCAPQQNAQQVRHDRALALRLHRLLPPHELLPSTPAAVPAPQRRNPKRIRRR